VLILSPVVVVVHVSYIFYNYTVSQKIVLSSTCYNLHMHNQITIIFGRSVAEKVRNHMMLCFPTSPI